MNTNRLRLRNRIMACPAFSGEFGASYVTGKIDQCRTAQQTDKLSSSKSRLSPSLCRRNRSRHSAVLLIVDHFSLVSIVVVVGGGDKQCINVRCTDAIRSFVS